MYLPILSQPGFGGATYLYAHARDGMFLPLLRTKGRDQRGLIVDVWTSDDWLYQYEITEVRRDQPVDTGLRDPLAVATEQLWLQTSQGPDRHLRLHAGHRRPGRSAASEPHRGPSDARGRLPAARSSRCGAGRRPRRRRGA